MDEQKPKTIAEEAGLPENWVPKDSAPIIPGAPPANEQQGPGQYFAGPLSANLQHDAAFYQTKYGGSKVPEFPLMPLAPSGNASNNAGVVSVIKQTQTVQGSGTLFETNGIRDPDQAVQNSVAGTGITITVDNVGNKTFSASGGDGLIHGDPIWWLDPAFTFFRDDFLMASVFSASGNFQSEHPWFFNGLTAYTFESWAAPYTGAIAWSTPNLANTFGLMMPQTMGAPGSNTCANYWPMFEYPGWKFVFVFGFNVGSALTEVNNPAPTFSAAQTSFYMGLGNQPATNNYQTTPRLPFFCGLRYDTDPGNGTSETFTVTSVSAAGAGITTYNGSFGSSGTGDNLAGIKIVIAGFSNAGNNGTFPCLTSTSTTITVTNSGGVIETPGTAGTASLIPIADTTMKFECVSNSLSEIGTFRNNTQGTIFDTGMVPTSGTTYRLEIQCTTAGTVQFTLVNGASKVTTTIIMPQWVWGFDGFQYRSDGHQAYIRGIYDSQAIQNPFSVGSIASISGSGQPSIDGVRTVVFEATKQFNFLTSSTITETLVPLGTIIGYPAVAPFVAFGNDNTNSPVANRSQFFLDFISFVRNPGVGGGTGTPNPVLPRYF